MKRSTSIFAIIIIALSALMLNSCQPTPANGDYIVWVASDLGCGTIDVTVNGVTKTITSYYSGSAPDCGASGCANFSLAPGTYNVTASCTGLNWSFTKTITSNDCVKTELVP